MIKVESRGKYGGAKIHLDPEECQALIDASMEDLGVPKDILDPAWTVKSALEDGDSGTHYSVVVLLKLGQKLGKKLREKLEECPTMLQARTDEEIAAILVKESEKASLQLSALKQGKKWQKIDPSALETALLKHVHKEESIK